jgi:hypothetical protein
MQRFVTVAVLAGWMLVAGGAFAQVGPYPPYPGQTGPPLGTGGVSLPRKGSKKKQASKDAQPNFHVDGRVVSLSDKKLELGTDDGRLITMTVDANTKFSKGGAAISASAVPADAFAHVDAFEDEEWFLTAAEVDLRNPPASAESTARAPKTVPNPAKNEQDSSSESSDLGAPPDAPGRPRLHRGKPAHEEESEDDVSAGSSAKKSGETSSGGNKAASDGSIDFTVGDEKTEAGRKPSHYADLIDRTRVWSETFSQGLPNFVCEQVTTRYVEQSKSDGFQPQDVISAKVVYEDGKEDYQQITVGGKRTNKNMLELGGSTSTGEFASTLRSLFSGYVNAEFKFQQSASAAGKTPIGVYDLKVLLRHSDWTIKMGGQQLRPAYSGSVWVDKSTAEVRHIEIEATDVPKNFPADTIAMTVDYEPVSLGTAKFLLPVHSENLSCFRGTSICTKNTIDFRNYHKYSGESTIEFK